MNFVRVHQLSDGVEPLRDRLIKELADSHDVLWLVPGGSNIPLTVAVMSQIPDELTRRLTVMLSDERFGPVGHADSNAHQLDQTGFLAKGAHIIPVLREGQDLASTTREYGAQFQKQAAAADIIIGQFGMGPDGHIAGILPGSPAVLSADLAASYEAPGFIRVTLTPKALTQVTAAYVFAFGEGKREALERLAHQTVSIDEQPAQLIRQLPEAYVYNDQIEQ
jgi:6-phosphogluconolactonase/glucosamine-6-phosphate isomerase/deaminase